MLRPPNCPRDLAEITHPDFPSERLIACFNPLLADERARKRPELLAAVAHALSSSAGVHHPRMVRGPSRTRRPGTVVLRTPLSRTARHLCHKRNVLEANRLVIRPLLDRLKSAQGHIVVRVDPGGDRFRVIILDDSAESYRVQAIHGPYQSR